MASKIHVDVLEPEIRESTIALRARISGHPRRRKRNGILVFEVPSRCYPWLSVQGRNDDLHDPFLRATFWQALETGSELHVHGRVSASLLRNIERYQEIVCRWWPEYRCGKLFADEEVAGDSRSTGELRPDATVLAFSGGLDSVESLVAHKTASRGRNTLDIGAAVFAHGFDIPHDDHAFAAAFQRAQQITDRFNTELIDVRLNLKDMLPLWTTTFSAGVAAVLSLFGRRFHTGLIAASTAYENLHWITSRTGSTPLTDALLSSDNFSVELDLARTRVEKTASLANCDIWQDLRVCWQGADKSRNCGECEKCVRQMLCMAACGMSDFSVFESPLTSAKVLAQQLPLEAVREEWMACYVYARSQGLAEQPVFAAMRHVIERTQAVVAPVRSDTGGPTLSGPSFWRRWLGARRGRGRQSSG